MLQFDEELGLPITAQEEVIVVKAEAEAEAERVSLPWRQSFTDVPNTSREREAAMRAALQALYSIHLMPEFYDAMPIDIVWDSEQNQRKVVTTSTVPPHTLVLPPCVPKATKLLTVSPHPHKVAVTVRFKTKKDPLSRGGHAGITSRHRRTKRQPAKGQPAKGQRKSQRSKRAGSTRACPCS